MNGLSGVVGWGSGMRVVALAGMLVLAACNGDGGRGAEQTLPPADTTTSSTSMSTTSTTVDYSVPTVIDAAYVEKVMRALDHVYGDAIRHIVVAKSLDDKFLKHLVAIYTPKEFDFQQGVWAKELRAGLADRKPVPGDPVTRVQEVLQASPECVVLRVERDFRPTLTGDPVSTPQHFIGLVPVVPGRNPGGMNPTPWMISFDGFLTQPAGASPKAPCVRD